MKDELITTLKTKNTVNIMNFATAINKTETLTALLLPKLDEQNYFEINIYKIS